MRSSATILTMLWASVLLAPVSGRADWPTYMNGNDRVGATDEVAPEDLTLRWTHSAAAATESAWEGPRDAPIEGHIMKHRVRFDDANHAIVVGSRAYFGSSVDHQVRCVDLASGAVQWTFVTGGAVRLAPTYADGRLYFGSDDGCVYCVNADNAAVVWRHRVGPKDERLLARGHMISRWPVRTGVLLDDGIAYFGAGIFPHETVYLVAADAKTGEVIWKNDRISQRDAGRDDLSPQGYLLADEDQLFVPSGRSLPASFDRKTGEFEFKKVLSWRSSGGGVIGGSRAMLADGQLYSSGAHHFIALEEDTGNAGFAYVQGTQMSFRGDIAYITNGQQVMAVNYKQHAEASVKRQVLFVKRRSLRGKADELKKVDAEMKQLEQVGILWSTRFAGESCLTVTKDAVLVGGINEFIVLDAENGKVRDQPKVDGEVRGIVVANDHVLASTTEGKIYAYGGAPSQDEPLVYSTKEVDNPFPADERTKAYEAAVTEILKRSKQTKGFALVLGSDEGRLAYELAKRTKMRVYGIESDPAKVARSRKALSKAGLYGHRVTIVRGDPAKTPLSNYFANLVVSDSMLTSGQLPAVAYELGRYVKPCGGMAIFGAVADTEAAKGLKTDALRESLAKAYLRDDAEIEVRGTWAVLRRGKLAGVGDWSHQYGGVDNACFSEDYRVKGSLGVLWYGDPGPQKMINRHEAASAPLSTNGRFFSQSIDSVRAYDAYNGLFLWEHKNPGAIRTGVFNNNETSNLAATDDTLFVAVKDECTALDAATGEIRHVHRVPPSEDGVPRNWGFVAAHDGVLYGTSTLHTELAAKLRRRGRTVGSNTDAIFAVDPKTGKQLWAYRAANIMHVTITISDDHLYFIESSISQEERDALLREDKTALKKLTGEAKKKKEAELKALDVRRVVALDAKTGEEVWRTPVDVTFCSNVSAGGGNLAMMHRDGHLLVCGANANGHYWRQFLAGEFKQRRLVVLEAKSGKELWHRDADYMNRPAIINDMVLAEPWAFDLKTGVEKLRVNPLTGKETKWQYSRPGHHCGVVTATPNMMFFRSGFIGYYDLYEDSGTKHFAGQRLGCWVNALPANGLVVIPEASAGCVCLFSIASTVVLEPREDREAAWGIYSVAGDDTPVKEMSINLGAPGDRRDAKGRLWLSYPRPKTVGRMEYAFKLEHQLLEGGGFYAMNDESTEVSKSETPWIYSSGANGLTRIEVPLLGKEDPPSRYQVRLHFAEVKKEAAGAFDIKLQGETVAKQWDVREQAGGTNRSVVREFANVQVADKLVIELAPIGDAKPILSAIEVQRAP